MGSPDASPSSVIDGFDDFTVHPSYPFYVHPSDSPGAHLVSPPFDGNGFVIWCNNMLTVLSAKNKLGIITGKVTKPLTNSPYYSFWERCNDMVIAWLTNSLSKDIANSVMVFDTAKDIQACFSCCKSRFTSFCKRNALTTKHYNYIWHAWTNTSIFLYTQERDINAFPCIFFVA